MLNNALIPEIAAIFMQGNQSTNRKPTAGCSIDLTIGIQNPTHLNGRERAPRVPITPIIAHSHRKWYGVCLTTWGQGCGYCAARKARDLPLSPLDCLRPAAGRRGGGPFSTPSREGGRGVVCAARKARDLPLSPLNCLRPAAGRTACVPEAGGRGTTIGGAPGKRNPVKLSPVGRHARVWGEHKMITLSSGTPFRPQPRRIIGQKEKRCELIVFSTTRQNLPATQNGFIKKLGGK